jgi:hypothetical protein
MTLYASHYAWGVPAIGSDIFCAVTTFELGVYHVNPSNAINRKLGVHPQCEELMIHVGFLLLL